MSLPQPPTPTPTPSMQTACYRHPDRDAWRRCTRCGRPACNECLVQAPVGSHCLECARQTRPPAAFRVRAWNARQITLVTYAIMAINAAVLAWMAIDDPASLGIGDRVTRVQYELGLRDIELLSGEWYRIVTSGFLHFGIIHFAFNMFLLFQLGQLLEPAVGRVRFALLYAAALLGGAAGAVLLQPDGFHGGASGAVFGLMAAAAIGLRHRGINPFSTALGSTLLINIVLTFSIPGISIGGHVGGIVAGGTTAYVMLAPRGRYSTWMTYLTPVVVAAMAVAASVIAVKT